MQTAVPTPCRPRSGTPTASAIVFFFLFVAVTLGDHLLGRRRTRTAQASSTPPAAAISALQNGLALAGDYMSAACFLGIAGLVALTGFDGLIYSTGWLVGWPA